MRDCVSLFVQLDLSRWNCKDICHYASWNALRLRRMIAVKPEHAPRRVIIREWMALPMGSRKTAEQAAAFAAKAAKTHDFRCAGHRDQRILAWLLPRTG